MDLKNLEALLRGTGIEPVPSEEEVNPLTPHQNAVKDAIIDAINRGTKKILVKGSAGVGKTFMVQYLIKEYRKIKKFGTVSINAPTNRAVSVLMAKQPDAPYYMVFSTIHKSLFLKRKINDTTGAISFVPDYNPSKERPFKGCTLIIVDEASMLSSELLYYLESNEYGDIPMIFLGDNKQLPPVKEPNSPVFGRPALSGQTIEIILGDKVVRHVVPQYEEFELTEIVRQGEGNPIIDLSYNLPKISLLEDNLNEKGEGYSYTADFQYCIDLVKADEENVRYLAWTNEEINKANAIIRKQLYTNPHKVEEGETIVFGEPYEGAKQIYFNSYELKIKNLDVKTGKFRPIFKFKYEDDGVQEITIEKDLTYYLINNDVKIIHEDSYYEFLDITKQLKYLTKKGLSWKAYYSFTEGFARFGYRYAMTVHKAQGGTFKTAIVNMRNLNLNKNFSERNSLWYTAITRAAQNVLIYNAPFNNLNV
jgi:exodeoxyribonuclease-5